VHRTYKKFDVIVAEQDPDRTLDVIKYLKDHDIPCVVVPEYMLSSMESDIGCFLIGAVTLKHDMHFVVNAGTKAVVSEMNVAKIPVYLMLTTNKFSYWQTKSAHQTLKTVKSVHHPHAEFAYERIKFSHDRLPLGQIDRIITEEGVFTPEQLKAIYKAKLDAYHELHRDLAKLHRHQHES
jgi:translation initiation factor 2B subunit (eIF-2B alpha/beta/delta family)